jgi:NADPH-dependent curcumin reductase CurA
MDGTNRALRLARRPETLIDDSTFELVDEPLRELAEGEYLVRNAYVSIDPTQRVWIREEESYLPPVGIGEVMRAGAIGEVVESRNPAFPVGTIATGLLGWQEYAVGGPDTAANAVPPGLPMRQMMGVLGATGITAYFGMLEIGRPQAGETVLVSGAAGATGSVAAQIAKLQGCRVVGIAGTDDKCAWLTGECGLDAAINYKTEDIGTRLDELCPDGIDVFFDNVGGATLDAVLARITIGARVALCGAISTYNESGLPAPIHWYMNLVIKRASMQGFLVLDYLDRFPEAVIQLATWEAEGKLAWRDQVLDGLENAPRALNMLFSGENTGKLLVQVGPDPTA